MVHMRALVLALALASASAFRASALPSWSHVRRVPQLQMMADDPTDTPIAKFANALQGAIQNSPVAKGKLAFVKLLAGPYDEVAVRAKLNDLIASDAVVMFSFPT
jgi:hypothetical protein